MTTNNPLFNHLCDLGVCDPTTVEHLQSFVRDRSDINVMRCTRSGVIFLDRVDHIDMAHYAAKPPTHRFGTQKRGIITTNDDTDRRAASYGNVIRNRTWLDFGAGSGAMLDRLGPLTRDYAGIEPQEEAADFLEQLGHPVYRSIDDVPDGAFDVITLFHVLEHLQSPVATLKTLRGKLSEGGRLVIEVPHARDFLITFAECPEFRAHTFWSEHLILHTRESLKALLEDAGLAVSTIAGIQRYPLANALHWLSEGKAGGHEKWSALCDLHLDSAWAHVLARLDLSDTLIAEACPRQ